MSLGIPYAHVWAILNIDFSGTTLPSVVSGPYEDTSEACTRNIEALKKTDNAFFGLVQPVAEEYAEHAGLKLDWSNPPATVSRHAAAVVSQTLKEFDLPGIPFASQFHYAGPFFDEAGPKPGPKPIPFRWEKLDGRSLVYASLGTLVNGLASIYKTILPAVGRMSESRSSSPKGTISSSPILAPSSKLLSTIGTCPSNVIVVDQAPQIELLKCAALCITHAGLNTALESLAHGVPMVAIPIAYDQFGVAARIAYHGVGEFLGVDDLSVDALHTVIQRVLKNSLLSREGTIF